MWFIPWSSKEEFEVAPGATRSEWVLLLEEKLIPFSIPVAGSSPSSEVLLDLEIGTVML